MAFETPNSRDIFVVYIIFLFCQKIVHRTTNITKFRFYLSRYINISSQCHRQSYGIKFVLQYQWVVYSFQERVAPDDTARIDYVSIRLFHYRHRFQQILFLPSNQILVLVFPRSRVGQYVSRLFGGDLFCRLLVIHYRFETFDRSYTFLWLSTRHHYRCYCEQNQCFTTITFHKKLF